MAFLLPVKSTGKSKSSVQLEDSGNLLTDRLNWLRSPDLTIIAHSAGGLVARAAIESPINPNPSGFNPNNLRVTNVITLGTPHQGLPLSGIGLILRGLLPQALSLVPGIGLTVALVATTITYFFQQFAPGYLDLTENSLFLNEINGNQERPSVGYERLYEAVAGTVSKNFDFAGINMDNIYRILGGFSPDNITNDGLVLRDSAFGNGKGRDPNILRRVSEGYYENLSVDLHHSDLTIDNDLKIRKWLSREKAA